MAKIVLNDEAPKDAKAFSLANENFEVPYETTDPVVISNALSHPWLSVEYDAAQAVQPQFVDRQVKPEDDALSFAGRAIDPNDPDEVRKALEARTDLDYTRLAVESGLDQDKPKTVGDGDHEVAITLAADDTDDKPAARKAAARKEN